MAYLMIVDDDEEIAGAMAMILRHDGHEVAIQSDTEVAMKEMQARPPDLAILDVMFPEDDFAGFELARAMRACRPLSRIPILMLTAVNMKLDLTFDTLDLDNSFLPATDFMDKPVDLAQLAGKVKAMLETEKARPGGDKTKGRLAGS